MALVSRENNSSIFGFMRAAGIGFRKVIDNPCTEWFCQPSIPNSKFKIQASRYRTAGNGHSQRVTVRFVWALTRRCRRSHYNVGMSGRSIFPLEPHIAAVHMRQRPLGAQRFV
jgi:hypothetical protein